jgi:hypothetical protein
MVEELIIKNPIISLLVLLVPAIGITWKILHALYVKPRDFTISTMQNDIEALKNEILKIEKSKETKSPVFTDENAARTKQEKANAAVINPINKSADIILDDLQYLLDAWGDESLTELQKSHLEELYIGKEVIWDVEIKSVSERDSGEITATILSPKAKYGLETAIATFDKKYKEALLLVKKGDLVTVSGKIERFFLSPVLTNCTVVRK